MVIGLHDILDHGDIDDDVICVHKISCNRRRQQQQDQQRFGRIAGTEQRQQQDDCGRKANRQGNQKTDIFRINRIYLDNVPEERDVAGEDEK